MLVMWSNHSGANDRSGRAVVEYMTAESVMKPTPDGGRERLVRVPPPEVLRGDGATLRQVIAAVPFKNAYTSGVLSFDRQDIDVQAFNGGDPATRRRAQVIMDAFGAAAFPGIPTEQRPPVYWTTHTHTGRLELNFAMPRAVMTPDGRLMAFNPAPPGERNREFWDAFRLVCNRTYDMADPTDPERQRLVAVPAHTLKLRAEVIRAWQASKATEREGGQAADLAPVYRRDPREIITDYITRRIELGMVENKADVITALKEAGFEIGRNGKEYVTVVEPDTGQRYRLKGAIYAEGFVSRQSLGAELGSGAGSLAAAHERQLGEAWTVLGRGLQQRADYHRNRYHVGGADPQGQDLQRDLAFELRSLLDPDGPDGRVECGPAGSQPRQEGPEPGLDGSAVVRVPDLDSHLRATLGAGAAVGRTERHPGVAEGPVDGADRGPVQAEGGLGGPGASHHDRGRETRPMGPGGAEHRHGPQDQRQRPLARDVDAGGSIAPVGKQAYKARLLASLYAEPLPGDVLNAIAYVDTAARTVRLADGAQVQDHGDRITATRPTDTAVRLMIAECRAKGWTGIELTGTDDFKQRAWIEAQKAGLKVNGYEPPEHIRLYAAANGGFSPAGLTATRQPNPTQSEPTTGSPFPIAPNPSQEVTYAPAVDGHGARFARHGGAHREDSSRARNQADGADRGLADAGEHLGAATDRVHASLRDLKQDTVRGVRAMRANSQAELDEMKAGVDLRDVAATLGFRQDRRASDRNHTVMRHDDGSKIIVGVSQSGHWCFSSNIGLQGTVLDLLKERQGWNIGQCRQYLRQWTGGAPPKVEVEAFDRTPKPAPTTATTMRAIQEWDETDRRPGNLFLERERQISPEILREDRFGDTYGTDRRNNAVFPYRDGAGQVVGTERRNKPAKDGDRSFMQYTANGIVGLWQSNARPTDTRVVICESPIDCMSYHELLRRQGNEKADETRYVAVRKGASEADIKAVLDALPEGAEIIMACDNDAEGRAYHATIKRLAGDRPAHEVLAKTDWNAALQADNARQVELERHQAPVMRL